MTYCEFCGKEVGYLPFKCNYCGGSFCGGHRLPENHECSGNLKIRQRLHREKRQVVEKIRKERVMGAKGERTMVGTSVLYILLICLSIIAYFYPYYLCISMFFSLGTWTFFSSLFVVYFSNVVDFTYFIILLVVSYYFVRSIENRYGSGRLFFIFIASSYIGGLVYLLIFAYSYIYFFMMPMFFPIGLASSGLLGVCLFSTISMGYKIWHFRKFTLKASNVILFLVIYNITSKIITSIMIIGDIDPYIAAFYYGSAFSWYIFDLFGLLGAGILYEGYYKRRNLI